MHKYWYIWTNLYWFFNHEYRAKYCILSTKKASAVNLRCMLPFDYDDRFFYAYRMLLRCICIVDLFLALGCCLACKLSITRVWDLKIIILSIQLRQILLIISLWFLFLTCWTYLVVHLLPEFLFHIYFSCIVAKYSCTAQFLSSISLVSIESAV